MESFELSGEAAQRLTGNRHQAITGVVASGNLEVLLERELPGTRWSVQVTTAANGFRDVWAAVVEDFVARASPGGVRISINDGGARPDTVSLRLQQGVRLLEASSDLNP